MCKLKLLVQDEAAYQKAIDNQEEISRILGMSSYELDIYHPDNCVLATIWSVEDVLVQNGFEDASKEEARSLLLSLEDVFTEAGNEIISCADRNYAAAGVA